MIFSSAISNLRFSLLRFAHKRDGGSAVEFAILLPFMLALYLGGTELGEGLQVQSKVTEVARTVADLSSQYPIIDAPTMTSILNASSVVLTPYSAANIVVTISQVQVLANQPTGTISGWSCSLNGTARVVGSSIALPTNLQNPADTIYLIYGEATYPYTPSFGYAVTGTINMYQTAWFYPRLVPSISGAPC
jgi:Flp pilus assembly protein TadG